MAQSVVMPQAGNTVESCIIVTWNVKVGDSVDNNTVLCEVETDKSIVDVLAGTSGTILGILAEEGDEVPVKVPIAIIGEANENLSEALKEIGIDTNSSTATSEEAPVQNKTESIPTPATPSKTSATPTASVPAATTPGGPVSPRARGLANKNGIDLSTVTGTGPHGRIIERDLTEALASTPGITAAAKATGIYNPYNEQTGSGLGGRLTCQDLQSTPNNEPVANNTCAQTNTYPGPVTHTPLKGIRKIVAERMMASLANSAQVTLTVSANATKLLALRARYKQSDEALGFQKITIGDLVCFATVKALTKHSILNAHLTDETLTEFSCVHLGIAVDTPRGLLVPTVRNCEQMTIRQFANTSKEIITQSLEGKINPELLSGATFTVSNLGGFGIESFTPLLNLPQTGILGVNTITDVPVTDGNGGIKLEKRLRLSLTIDHRVVDGADAARFLKDVVNYLENIDITVMG